VLLALSFQTKVVAKSFNLAPSRIKLKLDVGASKVIPELLASAIFCSTSSVHESVRRLMKAINLQELETISYLLK
jgi:hypothetical protein